MLEIKTEKIKKSWCISSLKNNNNKTMAYYTNNIFLGKNDYFQIQKLSEKTGIILHFYKFFNVWFKRR